jgi:site-specific DNA recombinase
VARTLGAWARFESEHKSERLRAKLLELAKLGKATGGINRPYGYAADKVTVIPAEAKILRQLMRRFLGGTSTGQLCRELNARGVPSTGTSPWRSGNLAKILQSPRIAGWRQTPGPHRGRRPQPGFLVRAQWPAIVSRRDVERAIALSSDDTLRPGSNSRWLLSNIALCGVCGLHLSHIQHADVPHRYGCARGTWSSDQRCGHVSIHAAFLDQLVVDRLLQAVADGLIRRLIDLDGDNYAPTADSVRVDEIQLASLGRDYDDGLISRSEWQHRRNRITQRVKTHRATLAAAADVAALTAMARAPKRFPKMWEAATLREQRALLRTLTKEIRIAPATTRNSWTLDEQRVQITWRA